MKVYVSGGHYHTHIDEASELISLLSTPLSAPLQADCSGIDLNKRFSIQYSKDAREPVVIIEPADSTWVQVREIQVRIPKEVYDILIDRGYFSIRFGSSQSIDLHVEPNLEGFV